MSEIITLPPNLIGKEDREKLEGFGAHTIALGRATRWRWGRDAEGSGVLEIYRGGAHQTRAVSISRDRELDAFCACEPAGNLLASGPLERVLASVDAYFARLHGEQPDPAA